MQGFIVHINKARDEDLIVSVLSEQKLKTLYRFYGARHSTVQLGYLVDFEAQKGAKSNIAQMRNVTHLSYGWNMDRERFYVWQQFVKLFYAHLRDIETLEPFYFELLIKSAKKWHRQNPKRIAVEAYLELLAHEGRLHNLNECFLCEEKIEDVVSLSRAFLPAHPSCINGRAFDIRSIKELFKTRTTIELDDDDTEYLYQIVEEGF